MITQQDIDRAREVAKLFKTDSLMFAADRSAKAASFMVGHLRRHEPEKERGAIASAAADAVLALLEAVQHLKLEDEFMKALAGTLVWQEESAIRLLERTKKPFRDATKRF